MIKRFFVLALTGLLAWPSGAGAVDNAEIEVQMEKLTKDFNEKIEALQAQLTEMADDNEEKSEKLDLASRILLTGDLRNRLDYHSAETAEYYPATRVARGIEWFANPNAIDRDLTAAEPAYGTLINAPNSMGTTAELLRGFGMTEAQVEGQLGGMFYGDPAAVDVVFDANGAAVSKNVNGTLLPYSKRVENLAGFMKTFTAAQRAQLFQAMGFSPTPATKYENDTLMTTRLRLNMRVKATENVEMKGRLSMYKTWGMQDTPTPEENENGVHDTDSPYFLNSRSFDGSSARQPKDNILLVDRAYLNWNNIGGQPVWFSIGRRPTTDGPPSHLRLGLDQREATPVAFMNYAFDGFTLGYAYQGLGGLTDAPGRIRFCAGRGFEAGPRQKDTGIRDVELAGFNWDVYQKGNRFINLQTFGAFNLFNVPGDTVFPNPLELAAARQGLADGSLFQDPQTGTYRSTATGEEVLNNTYLDRINMGNVYHTSGVFMDKHQDLNYFIAAGWTRTDAKSTDELGISLLGDFWAEPEDKDGYAVYVGGRYDIPDSAFKVGAEYNYGSENWLGFTPGHDDMYAAKLYTRGSVYEVYTIWDIPSGEAVSRFGKAFIRLGYQHYDYDYTYSGMWLGTPTKIDEIKNDPLASQFYAPLEKMDNVYLTIEGYF
jgi:hypothetical protein